MATLLHTLSQQWRRTAVTWIPRKNIDEARKLHNDAAWQKFQESDARGFDWDTGQSAPAGVGQFQAIDPFVPDGWSDKEGKPVGYNYNRALAVNANSPGYVNRDDNMRAAFMGDRMGQNSFGKLTDMLYDMRGQGQEFIVDRWNDTRRRLEELFA